MTSKHNSTKSGFTLLEFIIYFSLTIVVLSIITKISIDIFIGKEKIRAFEEVSRSGRNAIESIVDAVSEAESVEGAE